ncbi:hypothetical protein HMN09_00373700 [Mycena chlorophos]|uniref:Uncharacterized protein n=1 Tax=Mycena chlorophos TaxID=658473 RepID=A0A8H6TMY3_MYCCL|nr:hypothetical protein HMN09_00373700 [Mycena chlorophos]
MGSSPNGSLVPAPSSLLPTLKDPPALTRNHCKQTKATSSGLKRCFRVCQQEQQGSSANRTQNAGATTHEQRAAQERDLARRMHSSTLIALNAISLVASPAT